MPTDAADPALTIRLWPDGPPSTIDDVGEEVESLVPAGIAAGTTFLRNISDPTLTVFAPAPPARSIADLVSTDAYLEARAAAADDGRRAIAIVRERAAEYGLREDAIGMIGFSAGAFLAVDVALDPRAPQLAFVAVIYGGETRGAAVPVDAPPLFSVVAHDDLLIRIVEGLHRDWSDADRPAELHVFARGGHGFGMIRQGAPADAWTDLLRSWLDDVLAQPH